MLFTGLLLSIRLSFNWSPSLPGKGHPSQVPPCLIAFSFCEPGAPACPRKLPERQFSPSQARTIVLQARQYRIYHLTFCVLAKSILADFQKVSCRNTISILYQYCKAPWMSKSHRRCHTHYSGIQPYPACSRQRSKAKGRMSDGFGRAKTLTSTVCETCSFLERRFQYCRTLKVARSAFHRSSGEYLRDKPKGLAGNPRMQTLQDSS
jgi:hypothetical protein